jgi:glycosyltransferase involved in cell wall biosynthesis
LISVLYIISDIGKALAFEWIAAQLDKKQFRLSFVLLNPGDSELETYLRQRDIPVHRIRCRSKKDWPVAWWQLFRLLKSQRPDMVHCHLLQACILGLSAASAAGIRRRIYTRHHSDYHFRYFPKGVKWDKWCNRMATDIVAPSAAVKDILVRMEQVPEQKVRIIHHGFDLDYFRKVPEALRQQMQEKYNPGRQSPVIGVISRFTALKGIQYIIPAFKALLRDYPGALLLLFNARGDYAACLNAQLHAELPEGSYRTVAFEPELSGVYTLFDIFVQASSDTHIEAFGQTYVEALAAGVPSVFTLAGIAPDFVRDRQNALVVPFKDAEAIHKALQSILGDPQLQQTLTENGSRDVRALFSLEQMIRHTEQLYRAG